MSTQYLNVSPSDVLGYKQYYRITFDVSNQVLFDTPSNKLTFIYDHMQDSGALAPLSPNPVTPGVTVMTVDAWTIGAGPSLSIADAVNRLEMIAGGAYQSVRSIQKLAGVGDITGGAGDRAQATDTANQSNDANSLTNKLGDFFSGLGNYATLGVIALVAYAVITLSAGLSLIPSRKNG